MRIEELRIGNIVHHKDNWSYRQPDNGPLIGFDFKWDSQDFYALGECTLTVEDLEPIPLTEEWLLKFGCYNVANSHWSTVSGVQFNFNKSTHCGLILFGPRHVNFYFVHTFQNIIALTGEELTIKD